MSDTDEIIDYAGLAVLWLLAGIFVAFLVYRYSRPTNHPFVFLSSFIGWLFPFLVVILLPMDITASTYRRCKLDPNAKCDQPLILVDDAFFWAAWRSIYWTSFCLTMFVLPMLQSYCDSGYFTPFEKFKKAVRANVMYYSILGVVGLIGLIVLLATFQPDKDNVTRQQAIVGLLMALSNLYGLSLTVIFLAFGLVHVPRNLWHSASWKHRLRHCEVSAPKVKDALVDADAAYADLVKEVHGIATNIEFNSEWKPFLDIILEKCPPLSPESPLSSPKDEITMTMLTQLHKNIIRTYSEKKRREWEWSNLCKQAFFAQDVIKAQNNPEMRLKSIVLKDFDGPLKESVKFLRWVWFVKLNGIFLRALSAVCAMLSVIILWSETTSAFKAPNETILSIVGVIFNAPGLPYTLVEFLSLSIMFYICACALYSLFRVKVFNIYSLHPDRQTGDVSMSWFTSYVCKLTFPLSYNFMTMTMLSTNRDDKSSPAFSRLMGSMDLAPVIGDRFQVYVPVLVVVICLLNAFKIFEKIAGFCGVGDEFVGMEDEEEGDEEGGADLFLNDGRILLSEARSSIERQNGSLASLNDAAGTAGSPSRRSRITQNTGSSSSGAPINRAPVRRDFNPDFIARNPVYEKYARKLGHSSDGASAKTDDAQPLIKR